MATSGECKESLEGMPDEYVAKCIQCVALSTEAIATVFCKECNECLCSTCENRHRKIKHTLSHKLRPVIEMHTTLRSLKQDVIQGKPGKPEVIVEPTCDTIHLRWPAPHDTGESFLYQIRYKTTNPPSEWKYYEKQYSESSAILTNLKSGITFVFQVRKVTDEEEGEYSDQSDEISTKVSAASRLRECSVIVVNPDSRLEKRRVPLQEIKRARDGNVMIRKFQLGNPPPLPVKEKTILLVGATGSGKSTLVDGFINYILGVSWDDPFRYTIVDLEEEEKRISHNQAVSQTHWITTYCINPLDGSRLDHKLNIIDTPGFDNAIGIKDNPDVVSQLRQLFSAVDEKGLVCLDAVCFLIKAPDARLTPTQKYIFSAILSLFGKDIAGNINFMITFADGKMPPVIAALNEAKIPYDKYFTFNNSSLFAENSGDTMSSLSPMFWHISFKNITAFFAHLNTMQTKSLKQTTEVLTRRLEMELTLENIHSLITNGFGKLDKMREDIQLLKQHEVEINAHKNFTYTVEETRQTKRQLPRGQYMLNCLHCNTTCHSKCDISNDCNKYRCYAMDSRGYCTQCSNRCHSTKHASTSYVLEYETVSKTKIYAEGEERYRNANVKKIDLKKVVLRMSNELEDLENDILEKMSTVKACDTVLKTKALMPDSSSVKEHIDILIECEKQEARPGFLNRIAALEGFRQKRKIEQDVEHFRQSLATAKTASNTT